MSAILVVCVLTFSQQFAFGQFTVLRQFAGGPADGDGPEATDGVVFDGATLYGVTEGGGTEDLGIVYSINPDGTAFSILHSFTDASGSTGPDGRLQLVGTTLFGSTQRNGVGNDNGTLYSIETDGTGFSILHTFAGGASDGSRPRGVGAIDGATLYGVTRDGGDDNLGTIYSIGTDGTGLSLLHEFAGGAADGASPNGGGLILTGSTLIGVTRFGGDDDFGTIYSIGTDGTGFTLLHEFSDFPGDGANPSTSLLLDGSTLYGTTSNGSSTGDGTVFSIETDGSGFTLLHEFNGADGSDPQGPLILFDDKLFGVTEDGGAMNDGTIFSLNPDGTDFQLLHTIDELVDGDGPQGALLAIGNTLYGVTEEDGGPTGDGTLFAFAVEVTVPEPASIASWSLVGICLFGFGYFRVLRKKYRPV